ncbi:MAG TPA: polysaccharide deacetylase family protein [Polyangiaceae bacterium]|jgi:peptidoglycan/xylan/chitin deacetylase (PgdA/CDA1 family)
MPRRRAILGLSLTALACACTPSPTRAVIPSSSPPTDPAPIEVAVTVDDLPVHGPSFPGIDRMAIAHTFLGAFRRHHVPRVYGFVNGKHVDDDPASEAVLRRWLDEGQLLANHTYSHVNLKDVELPEYIADVEKGEGILKKLEPGGATWKYFRYPYLSEGDTPEKREGARRYLRDRGYAIAEVSLSANDWAFNGPFARCSARGDAAALATLTRTLVDVHVDELRRTRAVCESLAHREVPQILLLHIGAATAAAIDDLLSAYEREGVRWIDLPTALADPFYAEDPSTREGSGGTLPTLVARARGVPLPRPTRADDIEEVLKHVCPEGHP